MTNPNVKLSDELRGYCIFLQKFSEVTVDEQATLNDFIDKALALEKRTEEAAKMAEECSMALSMASLVTDYKYSYWINEAREYIKRLKAQATTKEARK